MTAHKFNYFEKIDEPKHRAYVLSHNHCTLCQAVLELQHEKLEDNTEIKETAFCPDCELRARAKIFTVH